MGRMKDLYNNILEANNGIPTGLTVCEYTEMHNLKIYNYEEYKAKKKQKSHIKSENSGKTGEKEQNIF